MNSASIFKKLVEDVSQLKGPFVSTVDCGAANLKTLPNLGDLLSECRSVFCDTITPENVIPDDDLRIEPCDSQALLDAFPSKKESTVVNKLSGGRFTKGSNRCVELKARVKAKLLVASKEDKADFPTLDKDFPSKRYSKTRKLEEYSKCREGQHITGVNERCLGKNLYPEARFQYDGSLIRNSFEKNLQQACHVDFAAKLPEGNKRKSLDGSQCEIPLMALQNKVIKLQQGVGERVRCDWGRSATGKQPLDSSQSIVGDCDDLTSEKTSKRKLKQQKFRSFKNKLAIKVPQVHKVLSNNDFLTCSESRVKPVKPKTTSLGTKGNIPKMNGALIFIRESELPTPRSLLKNTSSSALSPKAHLCTAANPKKIGVVPELAPISVTGKFNPDEPIRFNKFNPGDELIKSYPKIEPINSSKSDPGKKLIKSNKPNLGNRPSNSNESNPASEPIKPNQSNSGDELIESIASCHRSKPSEAVNPVEATARTSPPGQPEEEGLAVLTSPVLRTRISRRVRSWAKRSSITTLGWSEGPTTLPGRCPVKSTLSVQPEPNGLGFSSPAEKSEVASKGCLGEATDGDSSVILADSRTSAVGSTKTDKETLRDTHEVCLLPCRRLAHAVESVDGISFNTAFESKALTDEVRTSISTPAPGISKALRNKMKDNSEICKTDCSEQHDISLSPLFDSRFGVPSGNGNEIVDVLEICPVNLNDAMVGTEPASPVLSRGRTGFLSAPVSLSRGPSCQSTSSKGATLTGSPILGSGSVKLNTSCSGRFISCQTGSVDAKRRLFNTAHSNHPTEDNEESRVIAAKSNLGDTHSSTEGLKGLTNEQKGSIIVCELGTLPPFNFSSLGNCFSIANLDTELLPLEELFMDTSPPHNRRQDYEIDEIDSQCLDLGGERHVQFHDSQQLMIDVSTQPFPSSQPFVNSQPFPSSQPFVNTQPFPTSQPFVNSQPFPSSQPLVSPHASVNSKALAKIPRPRTLRATRLCSVEADALLGSEAELSVAESEGETEQEICEADDSESGTLDVSCSSIKHLLSSATICRDDRRGGSQCSSPQLSIGSVSPPSEELEHISCSSPSPPSLPSPLTTITTYGPHPLTAWDGQHININEATNPVQHPSPSNRTTALHHNFSSPGISNFHSPAPSPPNLPRPDPNTACPYTPDSLWLRPSNSCPAPVARMPRKFVRRSSPSLQRQRPTHFGENDFTAFHVDEGRSPTRDKTENSTTGLYISIEPSGETEPKASTCRGSVKPLNALKQGWPEAAFTSSAFSINECTIASATSHVVENNNNSVWGGGKPSSASHRHHDTGAISSLSLSEYSKGCKQHSTATVDKEGVLNVTDLATMIKDCSEVHTDSIIDPAYGVDGKTVTSTAFADANGALTDNTDGKVGVINRKYDITKGALIDNTEGIPSNPSKECEADVMQCKTLVFELGPRAPASPVRPTLLAGPPPVTVREWVLQLQRTPQKRQQGAVSCVPQQQTPESNSKRIRRDGLAARLQRALAVWQSDDVIRRHQAAGNRSNHITAGRCAPTNANIGGSAKDKSAAMSSCITADVKCNENYTNEDTARDNTNQRFVIGNSVELHKLTVSNAETSQCHRLRNVMTVDGNVSSSAVGKPVASSNCNYDNNILLDATSTLQESITAIAAKGRLPGQSCSTYEFQAPLPLKRLVQRQADTDTTNGPSPRILRQTEKTSSIVDTRPPVEKKIRNSSSCRADNNIFCNSESNAFVSNLLGESYLLQPSLTSSGPAVSPTSSRTHLPAGARVESVNALKSSLSAPDNDIRNLPSLSSKTGTVMDSSKSFNKKAERTLHILIESVTSPLQPLPPNGAMARLLNLDGEEESRSCSIAALNAGNNDFVPENNCSVGGVGRRIEWIMKGVTLIDDATGESKTADGPGDDRSGMNREERNGKSVINKCDVSPASSCRPSAVLVFFLMSLSKRLQPGDVFTILPPWQQLVLSGPPRRVLFVSHCAQTTRQSAL